MTQPNEPINSIPDFNKHPSDWYGLTKREYFAAMAMQGLIAANIGGGWKGIEAMAVQHADALIKALNQ